MLFSDEFIVALKNSPLTGCLQICRTAGEHLTQHAQGWQEKDHEVLTEAYAVVSVVFDAGLLDIQIEPPMLRGKVKEDCTVIHHYLGRLARECAQLKSLQRVETIKATVRNTLGIQDRASPEKVYEPGPRELQRMDELLVQMHAALGACSSLSQPHRQRLQGRVERLRDELSPAMSDFDRFWGLLGDARILIIKVGAQAKPILSRLAELSELAWNVQSRCEGVNAGPDLPQLEMLRLGRN
jgi:hypothetical protein